MTLDCTCNRLVRAEGELAAARRALRLACERIEAMAETCPYDVLGAEPRDCDEDCFSVGDRYAECWALLFEKTAAGNGEPGTKAIWTRCRGCGAKVVEG